jgi:peptide/nickel transport system permease protein
VLYAVRLLVPRLCLAVVTLFGASIAIFWAVALLPGDVARRILGREASAQAVAVLREHLHLGRPVLEQYTTWVSGFVHGDWGMSVAAQTPVRDLVLPRLQNTLVLAVFAIILYVPMSLVLGTVTALWRGRRISTGLSVLVLVLAAIPEFVLGILLQVLFAIRIPVFPPLADISGETAPLRILYTLTLPAATLALAMTGYAVRMMYSSLVSVLESEYVRLAVLRGLPRWRVIVRHAIPNALAPALRVTVLNIAWVVGGVVLVENIYNYPGIGQLLVDSIQLHDLPVVEAIAMILSTVYILANLGADLVSVTLNPRLREA